MCYTIETNDTTIQVLRSDVSLLEFDRNEVLEAFQHDEAIVAKKKEGYDIYLPSKEYSLGVHGYVTNPFLSKVLSNVDAYAYHNSFLAFKASDLFGYYWKFLYLHNFMLGMSTALRPCNFTSPLSSDIRERLIADLPSIRCDGEAYFKEDFEYTSKDYNLHRIVCNINNVDYLLISNIHEIPFIESELTIFYLGTAKLLVPTQSYHFTSIDTNGNQYWYTAFWGKSQPYGNIQKMEKSQHPAVFPCADFTGYYKKDHSDFILGIAFVSKHTGWSFELDLPCPAKKLRFLKDLKTFNLASNGTQIKEQAHLWEITTTDNQKLNMVVTKNSCILMDC